MAPLKRPSSALSHSTRSALGGVFPLVAPEDQALAAAPLEELRQTVAAEVQCGALAGASHVVLRRGKFDKGKAKLSDPVSKYIPFSSSVKSKPVKTVPTLRNLLTMTAGLHRQDCPAYSSVMKQIRKGQIRTLSAMCDALAKAPLQNEPGSCYTYSFCTDYLGWICEKISGKSLESFMKEALLEPLGMRDTHFVVPAKKKSRQATLYECNRIAGSYTLKVWQHPEKAPGIMSGGGGILSYHDAGMWSTAEDYVKFCQLLLTGLSPSGQRILRPKTLKSLWEDSLVPYGRKE
eukprot:g21205.t1